MSNWIIEEEDKPATRGTCGNLCKNCGEIFLTIADEWDNLCLPCNLKEVENENDSNDLN